MRLRNNQRKKSIVFLSSFLFIVSSFVIGISAYFVTKVSVSATFTVDISSPHLTIETLLGNSELSPVYVTNKTVSIKGSVTDNDSGIKTLTVNGQEVSVKSDEAVTESKEMISRIWTAL